jgi:hypothetical protein
MARALCLLVLVSCAHAPPTAEWSGERWESVANSSSMEPDELAQALRVIQSRADVRRVRVEVYGTTNAEGRARALADRLEGMGLTREMIEIAGYPSAAVSRVEVFVLTAPR